MFFKHVAEVTEKCTLHSGIVCYLAIPRARKFLGSNLVRKTSLPLPIFLQEDTRALPPEFSHSAFLLYS